MKAEIEIGDGNCLQLQPSKQQQQITKADPHSVRAWARGNKSKKRKKCFVAFWIALCPLSPHCVV
jgi:hypothetical protein